MKRYLLCFAIYAGAQLSLGCKESGSGADAALSADGGAVAGDGSAPGDGAPASGDGALPGGDGAPPVTDGPRTDGARRDGATPRDGGRRDTGLPRDGRPPDARRSDSGTVVPPVTRARIHLPQFSGAVVFNQTAIAWFGKVDSQANYADLRVGYNATELYLYVAAFDRRLWYDETPGAADLAEWDAVTVLLRTQAGDASALDPQSYRFVCQLNHWQARTGYQAAYRGDAGAWKAASVVFTTTSAWRGDAPNNDTDDRGWACTLRIPFSSLGLGAAPAAGTVWRAAVTLHDRDTAAGPVLPMQKWPNASATDTTPSSWGELAFGLPAHSGGTPSGAPITVRHKLNGQTVVDAAVGGGTTCGAGLNFFTQWGDKNYAASTELNVQNQSDIADWPCFSKVYLTFPLASLPVGKKVASAKLTLYQMGNAQPADAKPSWIQVLVSSADFIEGSVSWNNAPLALTNTGGATVGVLAAFPGWPGVARDLDVSWAAARAYERGEPLRLVLYSADDAYHSGKYFVSSDTGDWNAQGRPTLTVQMGN
ncbi:MAG: DNRLRE domain-containing protein [Deltaproteobacteria bacterium]|nr:DNRLRE domain-containing protein [Deltaproteobacteria bacterium]